MNMELNKRIDLLVQLGKYMSSNEPEWLNIQHQANISNPWFLPEFIQLSIRNIVTQFLQEDVLKNWIDQYPRLIEPANNEKTVGIVMAGNIPLVGFHDFMCVFISGNKSLIKPSTKDDILIKHLINKLTTWAPDLREYIQFAEILKNCDAYIATGSNSSAGYFDYYFGKFPHIIRRNRTSVAILTGNETSEELELLADDVYLYFGMGCRNVTKLYVPQNYNFEPLIKIFTKYDYLADHHKYKNNYDYNLALHILNNKYYMSNASLLIVEDPSIFSPVSQLNYEFYSNKEAIKKKLNEEEAVQCIIGKNFIPFGQAQCPQINDYADGIDTLRWLETIR